MIKKLILIFTFIIVICLSAKAQSFWQQIAFNDTSITSLSINSSGNIIAGANYHSLYYSSDNGSKWIKIPTPDIFLTFICIDDSGIIYVADPDAFHNGLQRTTDLGQNWTIISDSGTIGCYSLGVKSNGEVFATFSSSLGTLNYIYHSFDKGSTWEKDSVNFSVSLLFNLCTQSVYTFGNIDTTYLIGTDGIYRTTNNGNTWIKKNNGLTASNVTTLCRNNLGHLFLQGNFVGTVGGLYRSTNNAENWESINAVGLPQFYDFYQLITDSNNILYGISDDVYRSTDEGDNWTNFSDGLPGSINYILAISPNGDIFCGTNFGLYRSISSVNSVKNDFINPKNFILQQNYPNPFNPITTIQYSIPQRSSVTLKVYDILGNEIAEPVNEEKGIGVYSVDFDAYKLASGIYFYKLQAGSFVETKKMILIK